MITNSFLRICHLKVVTIFVFGFIVIRIKTRYQICLPYAKFNTLIENYLTKNSLRICHIVPGGKLKMIFVPLLLFDEFNGEIFK